jgi:Concanavalin A-like lectin/glucanases superfamily
MLHAPSATMRLAGVAVFVATLLSSCTVLASAFVRGAYYQLGDADPGAAAGNVGNDPTLDSFSDALNLKRLGSPHYAADVPALGPAGDKLSMSFANIGLGGPAFPAAYSRSDPLPVVVQGIALEAWVKAGPTNLDQPTTGREELLAYNGDPAANGFGFFLSGDQYVARLGAPDAPVGGPASTGTDHVLGPATVGAWHHLAYVYSLGTSTYYFDGKPVGTNTTDPAPLTATAGFFLGGRPAGAPDAVQYGFNGWLDEVRYQSFNPLSAGAFAPDAFLITPEPTALTLVPLASLVLLRRRGR